MTEIALWLHRSGLQIFAISVLVLIVGCTSIAPGHSASLGQAVVWTMVGKLGIQTPARNANMGIQWRQQGDDFEIDFNGPLGFGVARISGDPGGVRLVRKRDEQINAASPEQLLEDLIGHNFPVSPMEYWVRGLPSPGSSYVKRENGIEQLDWLVTYRLDSRGLPRRIIMSRDEVRLKLFVKSWSY